MDGARVQKELYYANLMGRLKRKETPLGKLTLGEIIDLAEEFRVEASNVVIAEAMEAQRLTSGEASRRCSGLQVQPSLGGKAGNEISAELRSGA
jgi:hypothetical protein